jgi:hypothetical protein
MVESRKDILGIDTVTIVKEYESCCGAAIWGKDGERFLTEGFLNEYVRTSIAPVLKDGRPNIRLWLDIIFASNIRVVGWGYSAKFEFAEPFLRKMLLTYSTLGIGKDGGSPDNVSMIESVLDAFVESRCFS